MGDCHCEISSGLASGYFIFQNSKFGEISNNLIHFIYNFSNGQVPRQNTELPIANDSTFGLLLWSVNAPVWNYTIYGEDNVRSLLSSM